MISEKAYYDLRNQLGVLRRSIEKTGEANKKTIALLNKELQYRIKKEKQLKNYLITIYILGVMLLCYVLYLVIGKFHLFNLYVS